MADDVRIVTESPVVFVSGMITAVLSAATFIVILWAIGGAFIVHLGGMSITIPGFLVVAALIYAVAASGFMALIGRRFIAVSESKNQAEAEYRYVLTRLRENGESIALLQWEDEERHGVDRSFKIVLRAWRDICIQTMRTTIVSQTSGYIAPVLPIANYPEDPHSRSVEEIAKVLKKVGLGHLVEHLDEERPWDQTLSGGEKQRLAFARIFLHRPDIIVLDEATAALDSRSEGQLMALLSREFEHATVVSVGHRSELEALHGRKIVLQRGRQGAKLVSDARTPKPVLPSGRPRKGLLSRWNSSLAHRTFRQAEPPSRM